MRETAALRALRHLGAPHVLSNRSAPYHIREEERRRPPRPFVFILSLATDMVWCPTVAHKENTPYGQPKRPPFPRQVVLCDVSEQVLWPILEISLKFTSLCAFREASRGRAGGFEVAFCPVALHFSSISDRECTSPACFVALVMHHQISNVIGGRVAFVLVLLLTSVRSGRTKVVPSEPHHLHCSFIIPTHVIANTGQVQQEADRQVRP